METSITHFNPRIKETSPLSIRERGIEREALSGQRFAKLCYGRGNFFFYINAGPSIKEFKGMEKLFYDPVISKYVSSAALSTALSAASAATKRVYYSADQSNAIIPARHQARFGITNH